MEVKNSKKILWKPHWTCCGKEWEDSCTKFHLHSGVTETEYKSYDIDVNDKAFQKYFKKNVRKAWVD